MDIPELYQHFGHSLGVATDSRQDVVGRIFFALKGPNFNGHDYVQEVLERGANLVLVDQVESVKGDQTILVNNTLEALQALAHHHRQTLDVPVYAITGSNGKTTTKELVFRVLSEKYNVHATKGNFNNLLGLPLTILEATNDHDILLLEMGSNAFGEIERLCEIAQPNFGVITNIGASHLEGFGGLDGVLREKTALYRAVEKNDGLVFVPFFSEELVAASSQNKKRRFYDIAKNDTPKLDHYHVIIEMDVPSIQGTFASSHGHQFFQSPLAGMHNAQNCATAIAVGLYEQIESSKISEALASYTPQNNRSQQIQREDYLILLDAYNANPVSMNKALDMISSWPLKNKIVILGDMKELGHHSDSAHQQLVQRVKASDVNQYFFVGPEMKKVSNEAYRDVDELSELKALEEIDFQDAVVLIKGSRSMRLEQLLNYI